MAQRTESDSAEAFGELDALDRTVSLSRGPTPARQYLTEMVFDLIVHSWDANHPLNEVADVLLPATIHAEKEGTFTNLQGRVHCKRESKLRVRFAAMRGCIQSY